MELLIMILVNNAKDFYLKKECMQSLIKAAVKEILTDGLKQNKISSTDYEKALDILDNYEITVDPI